MGSPSGWFVDGAAADVDWVRMVVDNRADGADFGDDRESNDM